MKSVCFIGLVKAAWPSGRSTPRQSSRSISVTSGTSYLSGVTPATGSTLTSIFGTVTPDALLR